MTAGARRREPTPLAAYAYGRELARARESAGMIYDHLAAAGAAPVAMGLRHARTSPRLALSFPTPSARALARVALTASINAGLLSAEDGEAEGLYVLTLAPPLPRRPR